MTKENQTSTKFDVRTRVDRSPLISTSVGSLSKQEQREKKTKKRKSEVSTLGRPCSPGCRMRVSGDSQQRWQET